MSGVPPALVIDVLMILVVSQLLYAFFPYRKRAYLPVLVLTTIGVVLGQVWDLLGLPGFRFGNANLVPALLFVLALQPLARRLPIRFR